jgi:hypothetical protein
MVVQKFQEDGGQFADLPLESLMAVFGTNDVLKK